MNFATGVEPTNETDAMPGWRRIASTASRSPCSDVERAVRQPGLGEPVGHQQRRRRVLLARLEDERVPAREREREHPHRDHRGEVERRDPGRHAERLAQRVRVDAGADRLGRLALQQVRGAAGELDHLEPALDLAARVVDGLAVLGRDHARELAGVRGDELAEAEQDVRAARERLRAPGARSRPWRPPPRGRRPRCSRTRRAASRRRLRDRSPRRSVRRPAGARPRSNGRRSRARSWSYV